MVFDHKCGGKIRHATRAAASSHAIGLHREQPAFSKGIQVYYCEACGNYHVGHSRETNESRRRRRRDRVRREGERTGDYWGEIAC